MNRIGKTDGRQAANDGEKEDNGEKAGGFQEVRQTE